MPSCASFSSYGRPWWPKAGSPAEPADGALGALGRGSWEEYDLDLDWQRFDA